MRLKLRFTGSVSAPPQIFTAEAPTVAELLAFIREHAKTADFAVKAGYPPETVYFDTFEPEMKLSELPMKLDGSQLTVQVEGSKEESRKEDVKPALGTSGGTQAPSRPGPQRQVSAPGKPTSTTFSGAPQPARGSNKGDPPDVTLPGRGIVILRVMPDDNSCLFRAVSYALGKGLYSATELRSLVASTISENPDTYNEAVLEQEPTAYCEWITMESSWGGGIEISILANFFDTEIISVDVQTGSVIRFGEGSKKRAVLVYSGIHYDALALAPYRNASPDSDVCVFEGDDERILHAAVELCGKLRERHYHTDTKSFSLRCNTCGTAMKGQKAAAAHSNETGHTDFGEYEE